MKGKLFLVVLAGFFFFLFVSSPGAEESVKAYMGITPENNAKVVDFIKEKTGITVYQNFQSFGEIEARVKTEAPNFNAEMVIGCGSPLAFMAKKNKWSVPYDSPGWKGVPHEFIDSDKYWFSIGNFSFVLFGNKDKLAKEGYTLPTSWKELLDPKWKGQIVMPSPLTSGTANMILYSFLALYGEKEGWKFLEGLDKNISQYTRSGNDPANLVSRGEYLLGITGDEGVTARIKEGYPIVWTVPKEGIGYDGIFTLILQGTKKIDACKKIIDALGSPEMSQMMAKLAYMTPRPSTNPFYGEKIPKYIKLDLGKAAAEKAKNNEIWKQKFQR